VAASLFFNGEKLPESDGRKCPTKSIKLKKGKKKSHIPELITTLQWKP
jgi:hypothetical protein